MSAAFDTLDYITLLHRLQHTFGLYGYVISWIRSYLTDRSSFVKIDSSSSPYTTILTGVPQGSVLGPLLFVLFILWRFRGKPTLGGYDPIARDDVPPFLFEVPCGVQVPLRRFSLIDMVYIVSYRIVLIFLALLYRMLRYMSVWWPL